MPKLVVQTGLSRGREYELKPGVNAFGRAFSSDLRFEDISVSGAHAQIIVDAFSVTVKDVGSTNGTFINRSQIREAFLQPGQVVSLGGIEMLYVADTAESASASSSIARTVALPQVGGIKIARPSTPTNSPVATAAAAPSPMGGGFRAPLHYPAPTMPTPNLTTAPTGLSGQQQQQSVGPYVGVEARTWKHVEVAHPGVVGALRCFGFGTGAVVLSAALWISGAELAGPNLAAVSAVLTGLLCGLAMRLASRNRPAPAFSMMALGFALLGMFIGETGQVFVLQTVNFRNFNLAGLVVGLALAFIVGGLGEERKTAGRANFA